MWINFPVFCYIGPVALIQYVTCSFSSRRPSRSWRFCCYIGPVALIQYVPRFFSSRRPSRSWRFCCYIGPVALIQYVPRFFSSRRPPRSWRFCCNMCPVPSPPADHPGAGGFVVICAPFLLLPQTTQELEVLLREKLELASHDLLMKAKAEADSETMNLQRLISNEVITLAMWGNLSKNPR